MCRLLCTANRFFSSFLFPTEGSPQGKVSEGDIPSFISPCTSALNETPETYYFALFPISRSLFAAE